MSIRDKKIEDLELMGYTDIAYEIIREDKKQYNTPNLFKEVCNLLKLSEEEFEEKIGDFFTALTTDQRFILIDSINWDLKENHKVNVVIDNGDEDEDDITSSDDIEDDIKDDEDSEEDDYSDEAVDESSDTEEDIDELTIVDEEDIEE